MDVGADELLGAEDGAVNMAFGGEVNDGGGLMLAKKLGDQFAVVDVAVDEFIAADGRDRRQVGGISGVSEAVEVDDRGGLLRQPLQNEVGADESGAAGDDDRIPS